MLNSLLKTCRSCLCAGLALALVGCHQFNPKLTYLGDADLSYYRGHATEIDYPAVVTQTAEEVAASQEPHTIRNEERTEIRDVTLMEVIHLALQNSEVIRSNGQFLSTGNSLFTNPDRVPSIYDPAIQESGVLFGGRGVEAALAEFDAQLNASMIWDRDSRFTGATFPGTLSGDTGTFDSSIRKIFGHGGMVTLGHRIQYSEPGISAPTFADDYAGNILMQYRQPLLAGAGTEYTRTAGPIVNSFGGITGVSQGVLIARINNDITLADFEAAVRNLTLEAENAYWDLYLAYRNYDTAVVARNSALETWRLAKRQAGEVLIPADEAQARQTYYAAKAATETARSDIYSAETRLRRLLGMPINEGSVLRPADEPVSTEVVPEWFTCLSEALTNRVELRRQKWNIKSLDLQLQAARSLTRPRLDVVGGGRVNGFGDKLLDYDSPGAPMSSFYESITAGDQTGWNLGLEFTLPVGLRQAHAQVRNYELRLVKAQEVLAVQELEIGHELAAAFQDLTVSYQTMQTNYQRYLATEDDVVGREPRYELGEVLVDVMVRAYERRAQAELAFFQSVVDYNKALANLQFRKGTLLDYNSVHLMEGPWTAEAQYDLNRHADARAHALRARHLRSRPTDFASDAPVGRITFTSDAAAQMSGANQPAPYQPVPDDPPPAPPAEMPDEALEGPDDDAVFLQRVPDVVPAGWEEFAEEEAATARLQGPGAASLGGGIQVRASTEVPDEPAPMATAAALGGGIGMQARTEALEEPAPAPAARPPQSRVRLRRGGLYDSDILSPDQIP